MEAPSAEVDPLPGLRWSTWDIAFLPVVDTARIGLLNVRVWRFLTARVPSGGGRVCGFARESQCVAVRAPAAGDDADADTGPRRHGPSRASESSGGPQ